MAKLLESNSFDKMIIRKKQVCLFSDLTNKSSLHFITVNALKKFRL